MRFRKLLAALSLPLFALWANSARADSLSIVISETGTSYYQINGGTWTAFSSSQSNWDSMITKPGSADSGSNGPNFIGDTEFFALSSMTGSGISYTGWQQNAAASSEGALVVTGSGTSAGSEVSNLLMLDGTGGIFLYKAPVFTGTTVNETTPGLASYGYTGNGTTSYNPGSGAPINDLGATGSGGIKSDLEFNAGFAGNGNGDNISVGAETEFADPTGLTTANYIGYDFQAGTGNPFEVRELNNNVFVGYLTPTVIFESAVAGLPSTASTMFALLGLVIAGYWRTSKRQEAILN